MFKYISKVLYVISGSKIKLILLLLGFTVSSLLEAIGIGLLGPFINLASQPKIQKLPPFVSGIATQLQLDSGSKLLLTLGLIIIAFFCVKSILYFIIRAYIFHFSSDYRAKLTSRLLNAYLDVSYEFHLNQNTSTLIKNLIIETDYFYHFCILPFLDTFSNSVIILFLFLVLAITDIRLLAIILIIFFPIFLGFNLFRDRFKEWGRLASQSQEQMIRNVNHAMGGLKETKVIGCEPHFKQEMERHVRQYARAETFFQSSQILPRILIETILIVFVILFIALSQISSAQSMQELTGVLGVFALASMRLILAVSQLLQAISQMHRGSFAIDMLYSDLKATAIALPRANKLKSQGLLRNRQQTMDFAKRLELKNVTYSYLPNSKPALENISLTINKGESIAFIGKSGAGKTTLVDIILGLLQPKSGDISVDGVSIYRDLRAWQNLVGYIPQSIFLIDDTIERNIAFGVSDSNIDKAKIDQVIKSAQLRELVNQLPNGVQTQVGERGIRLSGGQRQRIGIARALYHEREILVLDEATASLDNETELLVSEAINSLAGNRTLIIIAHRLSTVENCDRIYMLEQGQVIDSGSYQEVVR